MTSTRETMDEIEEFLLFNKGSLEKIRNGLKIVGEEEQQLLALRSQLNKVKRIREEQLKKDEQIKKLEEKINLLEYEKSTALRQNTELHEIMAERIDTLERHLSEKETTERIHTERLVVLEREVYDKASLEEEVLIERKKTKEVQNQVEKYREEVKRLKNKSSTDNQLNGHFQSLFENLRDEINAKDAIIADLKQRIDYKEKDFHQEITTFQERTDKLRHELDNLKENLARSERMNVNLSEELGRRTKENDGLQKLLAETEQLLSSFKATTHHEMTELRNDVQSVLAENELLHQDEVSNRALCAALTKQMNTFVSLFRDHPDKFEVRHLHEIFVELKRLKQSVIAKDPQEDQWAPFISSIYKCIQLVCEKRNQSYDRIKHLETKVTSVDSVATAFQAVEEKFSSVWEDAIVADCIVQGLVEEVLQSGVQWKPVPHVHDYGTKDDTTNNTTNGNQEVQSSLHREDVILSLPKVAKKMSANQKKISKFNSKRREKDYYELIEYVRQMIALSKDYHAREEMFLYLSQSQTELKDLQERYQQDVSELQRMSDEAYLAVKVNVLESERQYEEIKQDYERKHHLQTTALRQEKEELSVALQNMQESLFSVLTFLGTLMYLWEQKQSQQQSLVSSYHYAQSLVRGYERMSKDICQLSHNIITQDQQLLQSSSTNNTNSNVNHENSGKKAKRTALHSVGIAVIAMVHWRKLAARVRMQRSQLSAGTNNNTTTTAANSAIAPSSIVQSLVSTLTHLRREAPTSPQKNKNNNSSSSNSAGNSKEDVPSSETLCRTAQRIMFTLSDWGLLNHQIVATQDAPILLQQLWQRLQARSEQQASMMSSTISVTNNNSTTSSTTSTSNGAKYPSFSQLQQQQHKHDSLSTAFSYQASLLRVLAKPVSYSAENSTSSSTYNANSYNSERQELFCHQEMAFLSLKVKEYQARIQQLTKKVANSSFTQEQQALFQQQQSEVLTQRITAELRRTYELEMEGSKKQAYQRGKEDERQRQSEKVSKLEEEVNTLAERVQESESERHRLHIKLQKTHDILRATASHALQDMRLSPSAENDHTTTKNSTNHSTKLSELVGGDEEGEDTRDKSFVSAATSASFAFTASTAASNQSPPSYYYPPTTSATSNNNNNSSSSGNNSGKYNALKRSNSFSGTTASSSNNYHNNTSNISVTSSQSTTARYQPVAAAVVSSSIHSSSQQRYRYVAPEHRQHTPLTATTTNPTHNSSTNKNAATSPSDAHVPYSLQETHGRDHHYHALEHDQPHPHNTIYNQGKGHDVSPDMHRWTTSALWQDTSFLSDPSMSAVLSEKPTATNNTNSKKSAYASPYHYQQQQQQHQQREMDMSSLLNQSIPSVSDGPDDSQLSSGVHLIRLRSEHYTNQQQQQQQQNILATANTQTQRTQNLAQTQNITSSRNTTQTSTTTTTTNSNNARKLLASTYPASTATAAASPTSSRYTANQQPSDTSFNSTFTPNSTKNANTSYGDTSDLLVGYTPEVPDIAARAAQSRRHLIDQHRRSQSQSDRELQDIFQDIGRLTARLETRLSHSQAAGEESPNNTNYSSNNNNNHSEKSRASSVGSRASLSSRYQYHHK